MLKGVHETTNTKHAIELDYIMNRVAATRGEMVLLQPQNILKAVKTIDKV